MKKLLVLIVAVVFSLSAMLTACDPADDEIEIGYVAWACAIADTYLVKNILIDEFDVDVKITDMDAGIMWQALSTGDLDFMVTAWLPGTHEAYYEEVKDDVLDLGPIYEGAAIGLVVPAYVDIDSIEDLPDYVDEFDGRIVGIDAGAGIMAATEEALTEYDLGDYELVTSSDAAMTAELSSAYADEEWVVVTGWAPHWKFADYELKFLEDPKLVYGGEETINAIAREDFGEDYPEIEEFLSNMYLTPAQLGDLIGMMNEYTDNNEAARDWIEANREVVDSWLG